MTRIKAFAAQDAESTLGPWNLERRLLVREIYKLRFLYCGVCHSDLHQIRNEWGNSIFPMVPGHEIVGRISNIGSEVKKIKVGETGRSRMPGRFLQNM
ncbi:MAG: alcohol dehydrogenase catalytic domain-containing protein [Puia sp.]